MPIHPNGNSTLEDILNFQKDIGGGHLPQKEGYESGFYCHEDDDEFQEENEKVS